MENPSFYDVFERMWQHFLTKLNSFATNEVLNEHIENKTNPHNVTKEQVGLENVDNTSDMDKPISNATQVALDEKADAEHSHDEYAVVGHTHDDATTSTSGLMSAADKTKLNGLGNSISLLDVYPVGAIYISTVATSPVTLFGGTWEQIKGRFLLAAGSNTANTTTTYGSLSAGSINRSAGEQGGEVKHTLTISEMPSHNHSYDGMCFSMEEDGTTWVCQESGTVGLQTGYPSTTYTGSGNSHNNMPPYLAVYMWKRTA